MLVVDASAISELLLARPAAKDVHHHLTRHAYALHAPHLLDVEVLSVLRRVVRSGLAPTARADEALDDFRDLAIERYPHEILLERIWALRENFSAYDAAYLALAEATADEGAPLLTADARLAQAAGAHTNVTVILVG